MKKGVSLVVLVLFLLVISISSAFAASKRDVSVHLMTNQLKAAAAGEKFEFYFRWNGTDFYEFIYADGTTVLVDPTYFFKKTTAYDITNKVTTEVEDIHGADYILLSHTHTDHDNRIADIYKTYKDAVVVVPGNSAAEFCAAYGILPAQNVVIPTFGGGDRLVMPNLEVTSYHGKHTYLRGVNPDSPAVYIQDNLIPDTMTVKQYNNLIKQSLGNENLMQYNLVGSNGFKVFMWNGAILNDYRPYQYENLLPDIMFYQQAACNVGGDRTNPNATDLTKLFASAKPKLAIPNHMEYFTMDNLYKIGDQLTKKSNEMGLKTDYLEPTVLQWYGVNRLQDGTLEVKVVDDKAVPAKKIPVGS